MFDLSDAMLASRCAQGDEGAFVELVRRHRQTLARIIRYQVGNSDDAEDVLQDTLVAAWVGLRQIRAPQNVRAWLLQVARNRCHDFFRVRERREMLTSEQDWEGSATRFGMHHYRRTQIVAAVLEALDAVPASEREAAKRFYLDGLSIAEIAAQTHCSPGTIKRRLFQARHSVRAILAVPAPQRSVSMNKTDDIQTVAAFPSARPDIHITPSDAPPFAVDCAELRCWSIVPRVGEEASWGNYNAPDWKLSEVTQLRAVRPATVHDIAGVEIEVRPWKPATGWQPAGTIYGRLTDDKAQFLAVHLTHDGVVQMQTLLDKNFDWDWGELNRALADDGQVERASDGSLTLRDPGAAAHGTGAGVFSVDVGGQNFICLRLIEGDLANETDTLLESYLTREGRTVLVRRFCRPRFVEIAQFEVILDEAEPLIVNGITFLHWYDTLTHLIL